MPNSRGRTVVAMPRAIGPVTGAPEQCEVDLQARKKHQQQLSQLRHEIGNRPHLAENVEDKRSGDNAAEQQAYCRGNVQPARHKGDDRKHHHPQRELRKHRQGEEVFPHEMNVSSTALSDGSRTAHPGVTNLTNNLITGASRPSSMRNRARFRSIDWSETGRERRPYLSPVCHRLRRRCPGRCRRDGKSSALILLKKFAAE